MIPQYVRIENRQNFLLKEIPNYFPGTQRHVQFWKTEKKKCVEGIFIYDNGGYRFTPPKLYFYINFGTIHLTLEDDNGPKVAARPQLRDIEWEFFYNLMECDGFSGFDLDEEYTCHKSVIEDKKIHKSCYNSYGELKKYIPAREYLRMVHPKELGKPIYFNKKQNLFLLASRGLGKSYLVSVGVLLHNFLFDGVRSMDDIKRRSDMFVGAALSDKVNDLMDKFVFAYDNLPGAYVSGNTYVPSPFFKMSEGKITSPKGLLISRHEKKVDGSWQKLGTNTTIKRGIWTTENPDAATGGRYTYLIAEEIGLLGNATAVHGQNEATQRDGDIKIGVSIYIGTGGNIDKIAEPELIFRDPVKFDMLPFDDEYENSGTIGWFIPYHYCLATAKDSNGNTDLAIAEEIIEKERHSKKVGKNAHKVIDRYIMSYPIVPSEMFLSAKNTFFPVYELKERLKQLKADNTYLRIANPIRLFFDSNAPSGVSYSFENQYELKPLYEFKRSKNDYEDPEGCPVIYELPKEINGKVPDGMYIYSLDHYHTDEQDAGESVASFWILKTYKYAHLGYGFCEIVAEYTGKPYGGKNKLNETVEKMIMLYGATPGHFYFENTKGNTVEYFQKKKKLGILAPRPRTILSSTLRGIQSTTTINYGYELPNRSVKIQALDYLRDWLIEERGDGKRNLDLIPSRGLIEELIAFDLDNGNFDRVMGFLGCVLGLRELQNELVDRESKSNYVSPLAFFSNNPNVFTKEYV